VSHADIGAYLLGLWGMPAPIVESAQRHHTPSLQLEGASFDALAAVHVADALLDEVADPAGFAQLDERLVQHLALEGRVEEWRRLASDIASGQSGRNDQAA